MATGKRSFRLSIMFCLLFCALCLSGCSSAASSGQSVSLLETVAIADDYLKEAGLSTSKETLTHVVSQDFSDTSPQDLREEVLVFFS